jgi:hypothetical protein
MKITLFKNMRGLIHGRDPKRVVCIERGVLRIGSTEINIIPTEKSVMPMLFNGVSGDFDATFTTHDGKVYQLERVSVRGGWIQPPPTTTVELMELRCRLDAAEEKIAELDDIFDTDSLNFLIK